MPEAAQAADVEVRMDRADFDCRMARSWGVARSGVFCLFSFYAFFVWGGGRGADGFASGFELGFGVVWCRAFS